MRILHIGKYYAPIEGGIESINQFVVNVLKNCQQRVLSFNNQNTSREEDIENVPIIRSSLKGVFASQPLSFSYLKELRRCIRLFDPDVIHFHYPNPLGAFYLLLSIRKRNKLIVHWHSDVVAQKVLHSFLKPIEDKLLNRADVIIATSPNYANVSRILLHYKNKVVIIPCSINETQLDLKHGEEKHVQAINERYEGKRIVFFLGRHVEYKGIKYLLEAEKFVQQDCVFLIAGQGPLTAQLKEQYHSPRLHWLGRISEEEKRYYYHAASIFAFPSITRNEAFGIVLAEAMYCKCPTVTFTIKGSGVNWVSLNGETGIEVANSDFQAYAQAVDKLLQDNILRDKMGRNAKKRVVSLFTRDVVAKQYQELYEKFGYKCD